VITVITSTYHHHFINTSTVAVLHLILTSPNILPNSFSFPAKQSKQNHSSFFKQLTL